MKDFRRLRAMLRFPGPAFLNQVPIPVKDIFGTRRGGSLRQLNANLMRLLLFPWYIARDDLTGDGLG